MVSDVIINVQHINKSFKKAEHQDLLVLEDINLTIKKGEIIALLGKSGSGKSTLLRIIAGLVKPTSGTVLYRDKPVTSPVPGIAMVFQSFALMPWLTVLQNVELGLEAQGISAEERRKRALQAIDIIGLDGFESAYPKELSGGMCQRVGFARALVVNPDVLLMDEPFSALDVLTAENLRSDLLDLWQEHKTNTNAILLVTHNIQEAAILADRIIVFDSDPGSIGAELQVKLKRPRNDQSSSFHEVIDDVYTLMTTSREELHAPKGATFKTIDLTYRLPDVDLSEVLGLIQIMASPEFGGKIDLPELAESSQLAVDDLFPLTETLEILRFAHVFQGDIELSDAGKRFANADLQEQKKIFANHLVRYVPLAQHILHVLNERPDHKASENRFISELEDYLSEQEAERVLETVIEWGRYAEILAYDYNTGILNLENPE